MKDNDVRPQSFDTYVGQRAVIDVLRRAVVAARTSGRACGHVLLAGLPGCGKTSLAGVVAREMGVGFTASVCPAIEHKGELTGLLTGLTDRAVLFLDEVHGLDKKMQELLYTAMEDGVLDVPAARRTIRMRLRPFTLVAATTRAHLLTGPLRDRFAYTFHLGHYTSEELAQIALGTANRLGLRSQPSAIGAIGQRARGTPRVANRLVRACRDFMESAGLSEVTWEVAEATFDALGIDSCGLDAQDRAYLRVLCERVGQPVGVTAAAAQLGVERGVVEYVIEPVLLEMGFVQRTQKGRVATQAGLAHLHANPERVRREDDMPISEELS